MKAIEATRRSLVAIRPDAPVQEAAQLMVQANVGSLVVLDEGRLVGIVTDRDLVRRALARGLNRDARVDGVMTMPVHTIDGRSDLHCAFGLFRRHGVRRLVVVEGDVVTGMLTVDDLLIDLASDLFDLARPIEGEMLLGHHDAAAPATM
jgi:CBS domain-containing protein